MLWSTHENSQYGKRISHDNSKYMATITIQCSLPLIKDRSFLNHLWFNSCMEVSNQQPAAINPFLYLAFYKVGRSLAGPGGPVPKLAAAEQ